MSNIFNRNCSVLIFTIDLHEFLGEKELSKLYHIFQKIPEGKATAEQLRKILEEFAGCYYTDSEFDVLFAKVNIPHI